MLNVLVVNLSKTIENAKKKFNKYLELFFVIFDPRFWVKVGLIMVANGFLDLFVWTAYSYYVPSWVITVLSFGFAVLCFYISTLLKE